jgi:hypothetical protein
MSAVRTAHLGRGRQQYPQSQFNNYSASIAGLRIQITNCSRFTLKTEAQMSFETSQTTHAATRRHVPEDLNRQQRPCDSLGSRNTHQASSSLQKHLRSALSTKVSGLACGMSRRPRSHRTATINITRLHSALYEALSERPSCIRNNICKLSQWLLVTVCYH